jgi:hypothetical protein
LEITDLCDLNSPQRDFGDGLVGLQALRQRILKPNSFLVRKEAVEEWKEGIEWAMKVSAEAK